MAIPYKRDLTAKKVREIWDYNPETGLFKWKYREGEYRGVNTRCAGKETGSLGTGRIILSYKTKLYSAHRIAWLHYYGEWPDGDIDHIDMDFTNNSIKNLRVCTSSQNKMNKRIQSNNTSGYKGVIWNKQAKKWEARIKKEGKVKHIGYFETALDAHKARVKVLPQYHGEFARIQ